jgi:hypothetical protein
MRKQRSKREEEKRGVRIKALGKPEFWGRVGER